MLANMRAWNRWCASVVTDGRGRLHPVAHLSLRDPEWVDAELRTLEAAGVRLAMVAPGGRRREAALASRSRSDLARRSSTAGVTPVFHVADQTRPFDDAWYTDSDDAFVPVLDSVFLYTAAALACTDLIINGVFERHPDLRLGIVELSAVWVPMFLMMLDGGVEFTTRLNGFAPSELSLRPSEYFRRQVRVSSFSYELPEHLRAPARRGRSPHGLQRLPALRGHRRPRSPTTRRPASSVPIPTTPPGLFRDNAAFLLRR